jgi:hypothetical protein
LVRQQHDQQNAAAIPTASTAPAAQQQCPIANQPDRQSEGFSQLEPGDNVQSIPDLTLEYEDRKLNLIGKLVRITFSMRDTDFFGQRDLSEYV